MAITLTCTECGSGIHVHPSKEATSAKCEICNHEQAVTFNEEHENGIIKDCPSCSRKDFYRQKDFNRKIGVTLFVIAAILSIWTYGISFVVLYLFDLLLFKKIGDIVICYKCHAIFRKVENLDSIEGYNHEMNDRITYGDEDFHGETLAH